MGKKKDYLYKKLGDGYQIRYREKSNGIGGTHNVDITLLKNGKPFKQITDEYGYFLDFPGVIDGSWRNKLIGGYAPRVDYVSHIYKFKYDFALFSWMVQPDGRYAEDETWFGAEHEDEVILYSYMNKDGEFVTPFSDFVCNRYLETLEEFQERTEAFIWNSLPDGHELWVSTAARSKVDRFGHYKPYFGNTVVFPLAKDAQEKIHVLQQKLDVLRQSSEYLADALHMDTYHLTLHDLFHGAEKKEVFAHVKKSEKQILYILKQIQTMNLPKIRLIPTSLYNMNSTSLVLGFEAASEEDQENLMMLYELFQPVVELKEYTPHVTLGYFRYRKYKEAQISGLKDLIKNVNETIWQMKESGADMTLELDSKDLMYQYFDSMNCYFEGGTII